VLAGTNCADGMDDCAIATAVTGHVQKENVDTTPVKRVRHFSPDCNDDVFQPSPFRGRRSEPPSIEDTDVLFSSCLYRGYADVEDITEIAPYANSCRTSTSKKPGHLPREMCRDRVHGVDKYCPLPSVTGESDDLFEDILNTRKRVSRTIAFPHGDATEKKGVSKYKQKIENASTYRAPSLSKVQIHPGTSNDN